MIVLIILTIICFLLTNLIFITNADNSESHKAFTELFLPVYWLGIVATYLSRPYLAAATIIGFLGCIILVVAINKIFAR